MFLSGNIEPTSPVHAVTTFSTRAVMFLTSDNISSGAIVVVGLDLGAEPLRGSCNVAARSSPFLAELKIFILEQWPKESGKGPEKRLLVRSRMQRP